MTEDNYTKQQAASETALTALSAKAQSDRVEQSIKYMGKDAAIEAIKGLRKSDIEAFVDRWDNELAQVRNGYDKLDPDVQAVYRFAVNATLHYYELV